MKDFDERYIYFLSRRKATKEWGKKIEMCEITNKPRKQPSSRFKT
jgi:hypothetical protein